MSGELGERLRRGLEAVGAPADPRSVAALAAWLALHAKWSRAFNLTGTRDAAELVDRHLLDCAAILPWLPPGHLVDVGSGAGLPGLVVALLQPDRPMTLLDASARRTRFLEQAVLELALPRVEVVTRRCEQWQPSPEARPSALLARAVAPLERLVAVTGHLIGAGAPLLAMKGPAWQEESAALPSGFEVSAAHGYGLPGEPREHVLVEVTAVAGGDQEGA